MKIFASIAAVAAVLSIVGTAQAQESSAPSLSVTSGVDYSSGDYGTAVDTDILVVPVAARLKFGDFRLSASVPYIRIDGANIVGGDGDPIVVDPSAPSSRRSGVGDVTLGASYAIPEERLGVGLDIGARVKLPTAKDGLGTGETDYTVSAEVSKTVGNVTPFASVGYRFLGDPPGIDLDDAFFASVGASVLAGRSVVLVSYDYRQATSPFAENSQEIFGAYSRPVSDKLNFTLYGSAGLSDGAPDFGAGAMLTMKLF
jgi:hypothetical protein